MNANPRVSTAERVGRWLGRGWRSVVRREMRLIDQLIKRGLSPVVTRTLLWTIKLAVLAFVVYTTLGVAIVLVIAGIVAWTLKNSDLNAKPPDTEWRQGFQGFGLYDDVGHRIDPHDPTEDR